MAAHLRTLLVAGALTLAIGFISGGRWPHFLMGAIFALSLWLMLFIGSSGGSVIVRVVDWANYAMASAIALLLGSIFWIIGGRDNGAWWGVGVILAGTLVSAKPRTSSDTGSRPESG